MLIPIENLVKIWKIQPYGVLHVGAHEAEELSEYKRHSWGNIIWVEAQPKLAEKLKISLPPDENTVIQAAVWSQSGIKLSLNISSNSQATSILEFGEVLKKYPEIKVTENIEVTTSRLDEVIPGGRAFNFANFDIQGAELEAIMGLGNLMNAIDWIYTEVNKIELYKDCVLVGEMDRYLNAHGFRRISTRWVFDKGWGDALYIRKTIKLNASQKLLSLYYNSTYNLKIVKNLLIHPRHLASKVLRRNSKR